MTTKACTVTLTTDQLDDLYQSFKREMPLKGHRHTMTITEYYNKVWRKRKTRGVKQHEQVRIQRPRGQHAD